MAYSPEIRRKARGLYIHSRLAIPAIAVSLKVPQGTVARWKTEARESGDDWDIARAAATMQGEGFEKLVSDAVEGFTVMFQATMEQVQEDVKMSPADKTKLMASLADSFNKMVNSAGRASPKISKLGVAIGLLKLMADFVQDQFPQHATAFQEVLEPFGLEIAKKFNEAR